MKNRQKHCFDRSTSFLQVECEDISKESSFRFFCLDLTISSSDLHNSMLSLSAKILSLSGKNHAVVLKVQTGM